MSARTWRTLPKYRAQPTMVGDIRFHSKKEAKRYTELLLLFRAGIIRQLQLQVKFDCIVNGHLIESYHADFVYYDETGKRIVEDVKGYKTPDYKRKKKWMKALYGIDILET